MKTIYPALEAASNVQYGSGVILDLYEILKQKNLSSKNSKECKECMDRIKRELSLSKKQIDSIIDFGITN